MNASDILRVGAAILRGRRPFLSIEITRECPLRCPGCYAYDDQHLGGFVTLRDLVDRKGDDLVAGTLALVDEHQPLHLSIVGGDPLVRYREMEQLLPQLSERGIHVQLVTSAFRTIPPAWTMIPRLRVVVSIDGLQPEHDARRKPATYERILKNIARSRLTIHCTITGQMMKRPGYLEEFLRFWTPRPEVRTVWMSMFTPQIGADSEECLTAGERRTAVAELTRLRREYRKLEMPEPLIREFLAPPASPADCVFARTSTSVSADFTTRIEPCQLGGNPDCSRCGCIASMGMAAIGNHRLAGLVPLQALLTAAESIGGRAARKRAVPLPAFGD